MSLDTLRLMLEDRLRDTVPKIAHWQRDAAIVEALKRYSLDYPAEAVATITGNGAAFSFPLPSDFDPALSQIVRVEYPVGRQTPTYLDADDYGCYTDPTTGAKQIRFYSLILPAGAPAVLTYTVAHVVDEDSTTVPTLHEEWVAWLAAAVCYRELAAYYAQTSESTLGADGAYFRERTTLYLSLAKQAEEVYRNEGMMSEESIRAASIAQDVDVSLEGGLPRFYHPNRWR